MRAKDLARNALLVLLAVPVVGLLMGGLYSWPAFALTKRREPWLSMSLSMGLALTVFGIGWWLQAPVGLLIGAWVVSVLLLLAASWLSGGVGRNYERFGFVHVATLFITVGVAMAARAMVGRAHR